MLLTFKKRRLKMGVKVRQTILVSLKVNMSEDIYLYILYKCPRK